MITKLHHVAVVTTNIEKSIIHYMDIFGFQSPRTVEINRPGIKFKSAMLPIGPGGESYLQVFEPSEGPGVEEIEMRGEGALLEVGLGVDNIEDFYNQILDKDIIPVDIAGKPFDGKSIISSFGVKYFFLPINKTLGMRTEIIQVKKE